MNYDGYNSDDFYESDDYKVIIVLWVIDLILITYIDDSWWDDD